jgi:hypothetical protein
VPALSESRRKVVSNDREGEPRRRRIAREEEGDYLLEVSPTTVPEPRTGITGGRGLPGWHRASGTARGSLTAASLAGGEVPAARPNPARSRRAGRSISVPVVPTADALILV